MPNSQWAYHNPVRVLFQHGAINRLSEDLGYNRVVLITTPGFRRRGLVARVEKMLGARLLAVLDDVKPNPNVQDVDAQCESVRMLNPDALIALGGGSSMDTAKGLAKLLVQPPDRTLTGHFRNNQSLERTPALPVIAIPTTSGTGAEVTPFGTIWDFEHGKKYSVSGPDLYPVSAILDPELTLGLPEEVTISSGLDAISHALESAWNKSANPVTLGFATKSLQLSLRSLPRLKEDLKDIKARTDMMQASLLAGLAISQTRTALAHSISYPLTTAFNLPHGFACSFTLPALLRFNAEVDDGRLKDLSQSLGYRDIEYFAGGLESLFAHIEVNTYLRSYIPGSKAVLELANSMITPGRAENNIRSASKDDLNKVLLDTLNFT